MKIGSLFAGIGGFDLAFQRAGHTIAWHSEIDPHASAVLRYRWPNVPNLGDVTKINGALIEPVDLICGGFPCQDLSVAGKRAGFSGDRSVLAFEFLRIAKEMREATNGAAPAFLLIENVPGLLSSRHGQDFGRLLDEMGELRPLDVGWACLDSRYFGVAQRRRRVFIVADFGGQRAGEILALGESLRGDPPKGRAAREDLAGSLGGSSQSGGFRTTDPDNSGAFVVTYPLLMGRPSLGVRRLMPVECERLQAFPDGWTATGMKPDGTVYSLPDSARYKCLGNAVTVNVVHWIAGRMRAPALAEAA